MQMKSLWDVQWKTVTQWRNPFDLQASALGEPLPRCAPSCVHSPPRASHQRLCPDGVLPRSARENAQTCLQLCCLENRLCIPSCLIKTAPHPRAQQVGSRTRCGMNGKGPQPLLTSWKMFGHKADATSFSFQQRLLQSNWDVYAQK